MKKTIFSSAVILFTLGISACSSSSSGGSSNKVDKVEYDELKTEVTHLNSTLSDLQNTLKGLQNRLTSSQSESKSEIEKLAAKLAEARGNEAKISEIIAQLDKQLKNAIKSATESGDAKLADALRKSQEEFEEIKKQADEATKNAEKAREDAEKAKEELNKAKEASSAVAERTPISERIFGGSSGKMEAPKGKLSGGVLVKEQDGSISSITAPDTREGISYITVVDDRGQSVDVGIDSVYTGWKRSLGGASAWDHSGAVVRYGVYSHDSTNKGYIYVQGQETKIDDMPRQGEFTYLGSMGQAAFSYGSWNADRAPAYAKVNFADKTARLELNTDLAAAQNGSAVNSKVTAYTFDSKITENSIAGVANESQEVKMQAGFFGDDAKYLSGIYQSDKVHGVFGTTKQ
ncbi:hypothetical protein MHD_09710 [Mannheimia granulomatis]|uniref:Transferrin-binding protein B C-lobe/N-lobe beta-barrel domain-containing protein n=1 Tax=Mannheimia granulomatis TaxID=85402 RepID=A0A011MJH1_9PAST|nr:transferrin-binding protein-like solute binding protein [Mannheimia granulomatis]EXI62641.1 hypothetical protein AK33_03965 [Mannheimia granulomatis]RGE47527.1 hypothetical protein MHD_09710 [Mannheimia granulomatis]